MKTQLGLKTFFYYCSNRCITHGLLDVYASLFGRFTYSTNFVARLFNAHTFLNHFSLAFSAFEIILCSLWHTMHADSFLYFLASLLQCSLSILYVFLRCAAFCTLFLNFWQLHVTHKALVILAYLEKGISKYDVSISPSF